MIDKTIEERFWPKVDKSGDCWEFTGALNNKGYGFIRFRGRAHLAHRVSWILHNGEIPSGLNVCHHCDNPLCVRPDHFFLGTQKDNLADMVKKGRQSHDGLAGSKHPNAKLEEGDVLLMRDLLADGCKDTDMAWLFGVSPSAVSLIKRRKNWAHLPAKQGA